MTNLATARERLTAELAIAEDMKCSAIVRTDDLRRLLEGPADALSAKGAVTREEVARIIDPSHPDQGPPPMTDQLDYSEMIERLHSNAGVTAQTATDRLLIEAAAAIETLRDELFEERCTYRSLAAENDRMRGEQSNLQKMQIAPEGWKMVPVEPTFDMVSAMGAVIWPDLATSERHATLITAYRALLAHLESGGG